MHISEVCEEKDRILNNCDERPEITEFLPIGFRAESLQDPAWDRAFLWGSFDHRAFSFHRFLSQRVTLFHNESIGGKTRNSEQQCDVGRLNNRRLYTKYRGDLYKDIEE